EIFAWGKYGGFGRDTRIIGRELVKRGVSVTAVVPRRQGQKPVEELDGMRVLSFQKRDLLTATKLYRQADGDIYHSLEPSLGTYLAVRAMPERKHAITFLDPRETGDWYTEFRLPTLNPAQVIGNWLYEDNWLVRKAIRRAEGLYVPAFFLAPKAQSKYHLVSEPGFLPTPVVVPDEISKSSDPTVCFISRWDRRKRPELFFELVKAFPQVRFLAAGQSRDGEWDNYLRDSYGGLPNLEMLGFIDQFNGNKLWKTLEDSWVLVNTAAREGLPNALKEAAAHGCAILSSVDPDGFASLFGYHANDDNFVEGLKFLLKDSNWRKRGELGRGYVQQHYALEKAIDQHMAVYQALLSNT
ncbi:MAG: glycosyltransferase family 4 protein, partial [Candidatus Bathyarchaeia archaeon]